MTEWPKELLVEIEVPRLGLIKRKDDGSVDFISPVPCPFNYGSVPGTRSGDGDRLDAVVLGPTLKRGDRVTRPVVALVEFVDAGQDDPKWVCSERPLTPIERQLIVGFFSLYAQAKRLINAFRSKPSGTRFSRILTLD